VRLEIREQRLNESARTAVKIINKLIGVVNHCLANTKRPGRGLLSIRSSRKIINRLNECRLPGVLCRCIATLDGNMNAVAVAYKRDGNKLQGHSAHALLIEDTREVSSLVNYYHERGADTKLDNETHSEVVKSLEMIKNHLQECRNMEKTFDQFKAVPDETIADVIQAPGNDILGQEIWYPYAAELSQDNGISQLTIESQWAKVSSAEWLSVSKKLVEVQLQGENLDPTAKYILEPLAHVEDGYENDEIQVGDQAVLAGKYLIIAEERHSDHNTRIQSGPDGLFMTNCLKVIKIEQKVQSRRGQNRESRRGTNRSAGSALQRKAFV
jgi:hypothetical protein